MDGFQLVDEVKLLGIEENFDSRYGLAIEPHTAFGLAGSCESRFVHGVSIS